MKLLLFFVLFQSVAYAKSDTSRLILAWDTEPRTIDPRFTIDAKSFYLADLQHCSLINFNADGSIVPQLAKSWKWVDNKTLKMKVRRDAKFSDGSAVSTADIKATYEFFKRKDLKKPSPLAAAYKGITKIDLGGKDEVTFHFAEADTSFLQNFMIGILPQKLAKLEMFDKPGSYVGCGPYVLKESGVTGLRLVRNPHYSLAKPSKIKSIEIKIVKDELTRFAKLQKGELDLVQDGVSRDKLDDLSKRHPHLSIQKRPGLNVTYLGFNFRDKILAKPQVRRAIAHAINREAIIKYIMRGMAVPATTMLTPNDPYLDKSVKPIAFDIKEAQRLLDQAGLKDPDGAGPKPRFTLSYKTTTNVTRVTIAQAIADQLRQVGIKVNVQSLEWGKFKSDVEKGQVQMWSLSWVGFKDPDIYRYAFASESFPPNGGNRGWYKNTNLDKLLQKAKTTADDKTRKKLYRDVQAMVAKDLPYVFLWHEENFAVFRKNVRNFSLYADGRLSSLTQVEKK